MAMVVTFLLYGTIYIVLTFLGLWYIRSVYRKNHQLTWPGLLVEVGLFGVQGYYASYWILGPEGYNLRSQVAPVGFGLMAIGLVIILIGMDFLRGFQRWLGRSATELKTNLLNRFSRNPQYVGYFILQVGMCVAWWNFAAWIGPLSLILLIHPLVLIEEEHLEAIHGAAYQEYCRKVPRYIL